jgi:penicillin-binding protein 2
MNWQHPHAVRRRGTVGRVIVLGLFGFLTLAFFRVQVVGSDRYRLQSEENRLRPAQVPAPRGLILDRNGIALAENLPGYAVALIAPSEDSLRATLRRIGSVARMDSAQMRWAVERYHRRPHDPVVVLPDASFEVVSALEEQRAWIPGLVIQSEPKRRYPFGDVAAHVVGYLGEVTEDELQGATFSGARLGTLVGRDGLEREYDHLVRGKDGVRFLEVDAMGRTVREAQEESRLEPQPGETIRTTLDIRLQEHIAAIFPPDQRGAVVVLDPRTGEILALYSSPTYDPNAFIGGIDPEVWEELSQAEDAPLLNRAIQARYPPASPWKLVVAALAMRRGVVGLGSRMPIPCTGGLRYYNRYFRCWRVQGHGNLTLSEAIQHSCDVYFYQLGLRLQLSNLLRDADGLGFREATGIDLPNEAIPIYPATTEYYNRRYGPRGWTNAVTLNLAIGQGENAQTLMGMVQFYAMLANADGAVLDPWLVLPAEGRTRREVGLEREPLDGLREALVAVVSSGTAAGARIADLHIAGKTGTAQNAHGPDHGWFIGFAPAESPRAVVGAIIEFAEHGSSVAPMVTQIIARHLLGPDTSRSPVADVKLTVPDDSAPVPVPILPDPSILRPTPRDTLRRDATRPR